MYDPDKDCKDMIKAIKKYCKEKSMTPYALAKEAGISTSTVSYLLNGKTSPQVYTVLLICNVLDITISQLFDDRDGEPGGKGQGHRAQAASPEEERFLNLYRNLSEKKRKMLDIYIDMLSEYGKFE